MIAKKYKVLGIGLIWVCMLTCITTKAEARQLYTEVPEWITESPSVENGVFNFAATAENREEVLGRILLALADSLTIRDEKFSGKFHAPELRLGTLNTKAWLSKSKEYGYVKFGSGRDTHNEVIKFTIMIDSTYYYSGKFVFRFSQILRSRSYEELLKDMGTPDSLIRKQINEMRKPKRTFEAYKDSGSLNFDAALALLSDPSNQQMWFRQEVMLDKGAEVFPAFGEVNILNGYYGFLQVSEVLFEPDYGPEAEMDDETKEKLRKLGEELNREFKKDMEKKEDN